MGRHRKDDYEESSASSYSDDSASEEERSTEKSRKRDKSSSSKKSRKHHDSSASDYSDDGSSEEERSTKKSRKRDKSSSSRKSKKHHHKEAVLSISKNITGITEDRTSRVTEELTEADYFRKSSEFQTWLHEEKGKYFDEMKTQDAKRYFVKFIAKWNKGRLSKKYYKGISNELMDTKDRTRYKWSFVKNINKQELGEVKNEIYAMTSKPPDSDLSSKPSDSVLTAQVTPGGERKRVYTAPMRPDNDEYEAERARQDIKRERKRFRQNDKEDTEELAPRPSSTHEKRMEAKAIRRYEKRGRELSPDAPFDVYGPGGPDDIRRMAAKQRERREAIQDKKLQSATGKLAEYRAKEEAKMVMFREMAKNCQL